MAPSDVAPRVIAVGGPRDCGAEVGAGPAVVVDRVVPVVVWSACTSS